MLRSPERQLLAALREPRLLAEWPAREAGALLPRLRRLRLLGYCAARLQQGAVLAACGATVGAQLESALVVAEARARQARWELDRIGRALGAGRPQPLVALKGCAYLLARLPHAHGRLFADVDLLMARTALDDVEARLKHAGWRSMELDPYDDRYYRTWTHELPPVSHPDRGVEVDLHHNIVMSTARIRPDAALMLAKARPTDTGYHVLAPTDMALNAMTHLFYAGEVDGALRELVDVAALCSHFGQTEPDFWMELWPRAQQLQLTLPAMYGLRYAEALLGLAVPEAVRRQASAAGRGPLRLALMDRAVPAALTRAGGVAGRLARALLYVRAHWLRMPPALLARHLATKLWFAIRRRAVSSA